MKLSISLMLFFHLLIVNVNSLYLRKEVDIVKIGENENEIDVIYKPFSENIEQFISYREGKYYYETVDSIEKKFAEK